MKQRPDILFIMTDQQRFDTIAALGNRSVYTPNLDRLVRRGITFTRAYSTCPVCIPARYTIRTGCLPPKTGFFQNGPLALYDRKDGVNRVEERCGPYLARRMGELGYRTFGIGKFHAQPWNEDLGFEFQKISEEVYESGDQRRQDDYVSWIREEHPQFSFIEQLMGERTDMYYMPQMSPLPADLNVEAWAAGLAVEQIQQEDERPYFGMVSLIGPHPPCAPPIPFNRMYDPDRMPDPVCGDLGTDHMDEQIPWMNRVIWADDISRMQARALKARYYGEISYIDQCIGRILDSVEQGGNADNTLICFFSDHGDHLGDHHAWQKESYFEASCRVPFLVSWPEHLPADVKRNELVCLADLFGMASTAAGAQELRDGMDVLGLLKGKTPAREKLFAWYANPGTPQFKMMVRTTEWKYIFLANGNREQLFRPEDDPDELDNRAADYSHVCKELRACALEACRREGLPAAFDTNGFVTFPFTERTEPKRIYQFDVCAGESFPVHAEEIM